MRAVENINTEICEAIIGLDAVEQSLIDRFATMYRHHIDAEERVVLPALKKALHRNDWQAIGRSMAERRGLDWDELARPAAVKGPRPA